MDQHIFNNHGMETEKTKASKAVGVPSLPPIHSTNPKITTILDNYGDGNEAKGTKDFISDER